MRSAAFFVSSLVFGCATLELPKPGDIRIPPFQLRMRDLRLPSGMRVVIQEDHRMPYAAVVTVVGAGGSDDFAGNEGLAHLVEHLAFRATVTSTAALSVMRTLEDLGATRWNAYTARDHTVFYELVPKGSLPATLAIETRRLLDPLAGVTNEVFAVEREVVRNELRQRAEMAVSGQVFDWLAFALFEPKHPYARSIIGTHETLSAITLEDARDFARKHYRPENMTMVIAGDVDPADAERLIGSAFAPDAIGDPASPVAVPERRAGAEQSEPPPAPKEIAHHKVARPGSIARPEVWIAWTLPGGFNEHALVVERVLYAALAVTLSNEVTDPERDIENIDFFTIPGKLATIIGCRVELRDGKHAQESVTNVLDQVIHLSFDEEDQVPVATLGDRSSTIPLSVGTTSDRLLGLRRRSRVRWRALANTAFEADDTLSRAIDTAELVHFSGNPLFFSAFVNGMRAVPDDRVGDLASTYLSRDRARIIYVTPAEQAAPPLKVGIGTPLEGALAHERDRPLPPITTLLAREAPRETRHLRLDNGLEVHLESQRPGIGVDAALIYFGGSAADEKTGVSEMEARTAFSRERHHGHWLDYGADLRILAHRDGKAWWSLATAGNLENMLAILRERTSSLDVEAEAAAEFERRAADARRRDEQLPEEKGERAFLRAVWGTHEYGRIASSDELDALEMSDVEKRIEQIYRPSNAALVISGAIELEEAERQVRRWFERWSDDVKTRVPAPAKAPPPVGPRVIVTDHPAATQVRISIGCVLEGDVRMDATHDVLAAVAGDGMNDALRQQLGVTYGVFGRAERLRGGMTEVRIDAQLEVSRADRALAVIAERWSAWANGQSTQAEIEHARWAVARAKVGAIYGIRERAWQLIRNMRLEDPPGSIDRYPAFLQAVAKPTVDRAFAACNRGMAISIVGPQTSLERAIPEVWRASR